MLNFKIKMYLLLNKKQFNYYDYKINRKSI